MGLHIIVPIKYVPDIERVKFDVEKGRIDRSSAPGEINPFDLHALEAAVQIKERLGGSITVVSMGPPQAEAALRDAISRGADRAILLTDERFAGADTLATSYTLACALKKLQPFDLVICGEKTVDGDTGQVGPELAEHLGLPHVSYVSEIRDVSRDGILVVVDMGRSYYLVKLRMPALIVVTKDVNKPRLPTLRDKLRARRAKVEIWNADVLADIADMSRFGYIGSPTTVHRITFPEERGRKARIFTGVNAIEELLKVLEVVLKW